MLITFSIAQGDVFILFVLSDHQSKAQIFSVDYHKTLRNLLLYNLLFYIYQ